jgi:hypothetical protein
MLSLLDLDTEPACTQMKTLTFNRFSRPSLSTLQMAGLEPAQIPPEKKGVSNGNPVTHDSTSGFRNTLSQDPEIQGPYLENSTTSDAYTTPYHPNSQIRSSLNGYTTSPITRGLHEPVLVPLSILESCYAYALDRGNGQYTRLVPADRLPAMEGLPKTQRPDGLIILPAPRPGARFGAVTDVSISFEIHVG